MAAQATYKPQVILSGIAFGEGPRWHDGRLWFSDMYNNRVMTMDGRGKTRTVVKVPNRASGLGFTPEGRLLVVSMLDKKLLRLDGRKLTTVADISSLCGGDANDMVVDGRGRAYIGNLGYPLHEGGRQKPANLVLVEPDGRYRVVADGLIVPNGAVITPDGKRLIIAESLAHRLTAFRIAADGSLSERRVFADFGDQIPDGICLDARGGVWAALPRAEEVVRVLDGGRITGRVKTPGKLAIACMLGGRDRRTLYILTAKTLRDGRPGPGNSVGWIERVRVKIAGAGWP